MEICRSAIALEPANHPEELAIHHLTLIFMTADSYYNDYNSQIVACSIGSEGVPQGKSYRQIEHHSHLGRETLV